MTINEIDKIAQLLSQHKLGILTSEEKHALESWIRESQYRQKWFDNFNKKDDFLFHNMEQENQYDAAIAYLKVFERRDQFKLRKKKNRYLYSTIAASLLLLIGFSSYFFSDLNYRINPIKTEIISPGESKAVLILDDGQEFALHETMKDTIKLEDGNVTTSGEKITYFVSNCKKQELSYNTLKVPRKGEFQLTLSDGTNVWLNSESSLRYPTAFGSHQRKVYLVGEAYFDVSTDTLKPFIVEMCQTQIEVIGTSFNARAYSDEHTILTTLVNGEVLISSADQRIKLYPNEQAILNLDNGMLIKKHVDVLQYTAWHHGRFIFCEQTLEEIMHTLSRWYDIQVFFETETMKQISFTGNLKRYDDFNKIIKMIELTGLAKFKIQGTTVIVAK